MAYNANDLYQTATGLGSGLRTFPSSVQPKTFKLGSGTLAALTPLTFEDASHKWIPWTGGSATEVNVITAAATVATDGTFDLTINGTLIADIDHDVAAAALETLIADALGITENDDVTCAEAGGGLDADNGTMTITWSGEMSEQDVDITAVFDFTGDDHVLSTSVAGLTDVRIDGFVWPDSVVLDADEEVLGQVMLGGRVHVDDIPIISGYTSGTLKAALRDKQVRDSGFIIEGLEGFH